MELGTRIKLWRTARGFSQRSFAAQLTLTPAAVSLWESNRTEPSLHSLNAIVAALGLTMERFFGTVPKAKKAKAA